MSVTFTTRFFYPSTFVYRYTRTQAHYPLAFCLLYTVLASGVYTRDTRLPSYALLPVVPIYMVWCTPGSDRIVLFVTKSKTKSVRPTEARAGDAPALSAAMAALGWLSYRMQAPLVHAIRPCFSAGRAHRARKSGTEPNERAPTPVLASSLYRATRQGWGPNGQPPSWLLPAHSPGRSCPLSLPEIHGCHSTSQSTPTTEVTARAQIARARLGLVTKRCLEVPPERMQGGMLPHSTL